MSMAPLSSASASPPQPARRVLLLGGIRSGKSALAESLLSGSGPVTYVATAARDDTDPAWVARLLAHRERRPADWTTEETGTDPDRLAGLLAAASPAQVLLIDDLGGWLTAVLTAAGRWDDPAVADWPAGVLADALAGSSAARVVMVSPEVGWALVPEHESGRTFADALGALNRRIATVCDAVGLVVAGRPMWLPDAALAAPAVRQVADEPAAPAEVLHWPGYADFVAANAETTELPLVLARPAPATPATDPQPAAGGTDPGRVPGDSGQEPGTGGQEPGAGGQEPGAGGQEQVAGGQEPGAGGADLDAAAAGASQPTTPVPAVPPAPLPEVPGVDQVVGDRAVERLRAMDVPGAGLGSLVPVLRFGAVTQHRPDPVPWRQIHTLLLCGDHAGGAGAGDTPAAAAARLARATAGDGVLALLAGQAGARIVPVPCPPSAAIEAGDALGPDAAAAAVEQGRQLADVAVDSGADLLVLASCGAGAGVAATAVIALLASGEPAAMLPRAAHADGTVDDAAWMRWCTTLRDALHRYRSRPWDGRSVLAALGGGEVAVAAGVLLGAAARRTPVLIDGPVGAAAALTARDLAGELGGWLLLADAGGHPAVSLAATLLSLQPLVDLRLGLGEGAGALAVLPLLRTALTVAATANPDQQHPDPTQPADEPGGVPTAGPDGGPDDGPAGVPAGVPDDGPAGVPAGEPGDGSAGAPGDAPTGAPATGW